MAKSVTNWWHPKATADVAALTKEHRKRFPGNQLAQIGDYYKVAYSSGASRPLGALSTDEVMLLAPVVSPFE